MTATPTDALRLVPTKATPQQLETAAFNLSAEIGAAGAMKLGPHIERAYELLVAAAPASPLPGDGWQDISTAPKDGRNILAWGYLHDDGGPYETDGRSFMGETPHEMVVYFSPEFGIWRDRSDGGSYAGLTHWMPLPSPPIEVQK